MQELAPLELPERRRLPTPSKVSTLAEATIDFEDTVEEGGPD